MMALVRAGLCKSPVQLAQSENMLSSAAQLRNLRVAYLQPAVESDSSQLAPNKRHQASHQV